MLTGAINRTEFLDRLVSSLIAESGHAVLGGYFFFGTAHRLAERVETALDRAPRPRFVVLNFRRVTGVDTSAARALARLGEVCRQKEVAFYLADLAEPAARLILAQMPVPDVAGPIFVARLDDALEAVESRLLADDPADAADAPGLLENLRLSHSAADLDSYFQTVTVPAGAKVIAQGASSDSLLVLCFGALRAEIAGGSGPPVTVARSLLGALVGAIGFYAGVPRTARVVAEAPCEFLRIGAAALDCMRRDDPALLADFHRAIAAGMARRLRRTTALVADAELLAG